MTLRLRAKKPIAQKSRFQAVIYANRGVGKSHFCCSLPNVYYIDTEGLEKYKHFVTMLGKNNSELVRLNDLNEIITELKALLSIKHDFKTVVIDSITFPFHLLANMEAERIAKKESSEGTDYGKNLAKSKRLTFEIGMLLTRLDMNVIVIAHEKTKFEKDKEIGKTSDVTDKMEYALGTVINLRRSGDKVTAIVEKSRYSELKSNEILDFTDGYQTLVQRFGENVFVDQAEVIELASREQIEELTRLLAVLHIPDEKIQKLKANAQAADFDQMSSKHIQSAIDFYQNQHLKAKGE